MRQYHAARPAPDIMLMLQWQTLTQHETKNHSRNVEILKKHIRTLNDRSNQMDLQNVSNREDNNTQSSSNILFLEEDPRRARIRR